MLMKVVGYDTFIGAVAYRNFRLLLQNASGIQSILFGGIGYIAYEWYSTPSFMETV